MGGDGNSDAVTFNGQGRDKGFRGGNGQNRFGGQGFCGNGGGFGQNGQGFSQGNQMGGGMGPPPPPMGRPPMGPPPQMQGGFGGGGMNRGAYPMPPGMPPGMETTTAAA